MDQAKNKTESVIIGNCLGCHGLVRIPESANAKSKVRCPHCGDSYPLQQVLIDAVPELELLVDETASQSDQNAEVEKKSEAKEKFVVPVQLSKGAKRSNRRSRRRSKSERGDNSRGEPSRRRSPERPSRRHEEIEFPNGGVGTANPSVANLRSSERKKLPRRGKRKVVQQSTFGESTKVLIGGLLAFPIAYLLIFWVFHQDPLNLGPTISRVVPFAVPAKLRGPESEDAAEIEVESKNVDRKKSGSSLLGDDEEYELPIPDVDPDKIGPIEFD